jgi:hypothetical protein
LRKRKKAKKNFKNPKENSKKAKEKNKKIREELNSSLISIKIAKQLVA